MFLHLVDLVGAEFRLVLELSIVDTHRDVNNQWILLGIDAVLYLCFVFENIVPVKHLKVAE